MLIRRHMVVRRCLWSGNKGQECFAVGTLFVVIYVSVAMVSRRRAISGQNRHASLK